MGSIGRRERASALSHFSTRSMPRVPKCSTGSTGRTSGGTTGSGSIARRRSRSGSGSIARGGTTTGRARRRRLLNRSDGRLLDRGHDWRYWRKRWWLDRLLVHRCRCGWRVDELVTESPVDWVLICEREIRRVEHQSIAGRFDLLVVEQPRGIALRGEWRFRLLRLRQGPVGFVFLALRGNVIDRGTYIFINDIFIKEHRRQCCHRSSRASALMPSAFLSSSFRSSTSVAAAPGSSMSTPATPRALSTTAS